MSYLLEGIVVAKSRKHGGNCVVIFDESSRTFYRLVSDDIRRKDGELFDSECCDENGIAIDLKDRVKFHVKSVHAMKHDFQHENLALDTSKRFVIIEKSINSKTIKNIVEDFLCKDEYIFGNDCLVINSEEAQKEKRSFVLARVWNLEFVSIENANGEIKCVCNFEYNYVYYRNIRVTISKTSEEDVKKYSGKEYRTAILGLSFGKPFKDGLHYKFVCSFLTGNRKKG